MPAAVNAGKEAAAKLMQECVAARASAARKEIAAAEAELASTGRQAKKVTMWNMAAALFTLLAVTIAAGAIFWH